MNIGALVRDFGIPLAFLVVAVVALWRVWRTERRLREQDLKERLQLFADRESELYTLYRKLALRELDRLVRKRKKGKRKNEGDREQDT
ncbi:hypothetical protein JXM67_02670 [candidate division WOR-3 bacterium]|nr:hypothetical protein [candidate division WOR-3 bacterium]